MTPPAVLLPATFAPSAERPASPDPAAMALLGQRWETARRLCVERLAQTPAPEEEARLLRQLHRALRELGDRPGAEAALERLRPVDDAEVLDIHLQAADDLLWFAGPDFYRISAEGRAGFSPEEYMDGMRSAAKRRIAAASALARDDDQRRRVDEMLTQACSPYYVSSARKEAPAPAPRKAGRGSLAGVLRWPDGAAAAGIRLTLGLQMGPVTPTPRGPELLPAVGMSWRPQIPPLETRTADTGADGRFLFADVPEGVHEFLAATLDPARHAIATRFLAYGVAVRPGAETRLDLAVGEWTSAPARQVPQPFPDELRREGRLFRLVAIETLKNPFDYDFPRQPLSLDLPDDDAGDLLLFSSADPLTPQLLQRTGRSVTCLAGLPRRSDCVLALYRTDGSRAPQLPALALRPDASDAATVLDTGRAAFRFPLDGPLDAPPLLAVRGRDGVWRGRGRLRLPEGLAVASRRTETLVSGPLFATVRIAYRFSNGTEASWTFTAYRDEPTLLVRETVPEIEGAAFEFSLREWSGGRGYLHWKPEGMGVHWSDLRTEDRELARLQESVAWWIPPLGFGYAMTSPHPGDRDLVAVFTLRRGEWIDRKFHLLAQGPGDANRELDWPFPEMVGSTISMITAHTDASGDAFYRFGFFDGERQWGLLVSTPEENDGPRKELSAVQHKYSSPRLQDFKDWHLDEPDRIQRPFVVAHRADLVALREKSRSPRFAAIWERIRSGKASGASQGLRFAVEGDPAIAWRKKLELVHAAPIYSQMVLLGRDFGDLYSPVGGRGLTPWAEEYDLIAASGAFTPGEERTVRQFLLLMGHMFMETDFMNWRHNSRNANFEADRVDIVGTIGIAFQGSPDAQRFIDHSVALMEKSLEVYCTPGSGKWYENPACYYLHASKCRMNLAVHLARHGLFDATRIPRLKDFLRWGILVLTPPCPHSYAQMRDGLDAEGYRAAGKVRRISPVGDHAHLGPWVPEHYALLSALYRPSDPEFADMLLAAYLEGGEDGGHAGNAPLLFATLSEDDLRPVSLPALPSRRLEGFGAVFRGGFGTERESFLLLKQGPGGYRFHRTEGSLIYFAGGKPLLYEGGEAGETWRHSTLSFHEAAMPLAPGHVERFHDLPGLGFVQGVHPKALSPGDPIFLSDNCHHDLVRLAHERFAEPNPADVCSILVAGDDYVVIHDDLRIDPSIPCRFHLQVVADDHEGDAAGGYRFRGRFGIDLQVLFPGQTLVEEAVSQLPIVDLRPEAECFTTRHLQVRAEAPRHYLAVLRPLAAGAALLSARALGEGPCRGVAVRGDGIDDHLFLGREAFSHDQDGVGFAGRYGGVLRRPGTLRLLLLAGTRLEAGGFRVESEGPAVAVSVEGGSVSIVAEGRGAFSISGPGFSRHGLLEGGRAAFPA